MIVVLVLYQFVSSCLEFGVHLPCNLDRSAVQADDASLALKQFNDRAKNLLTILNCLSAVKKDYSSQKNELKKAVLCCVNVNVRAKNLKLQCVSRKPSFFFQILIGQGQGPALS